MRRIGFPGTGDIAAAMVSTIVQDGHDILVSERNAILSAEALEMGLDGLRARLGSSGKTPR